MKRGRTVAFDSVDGSAEAARQIIRVRFAEALQAQRSLARKDDEAMHAFRLACKRLRYAIERFDPQVTGLQAAARTLEVMTDELGAAHDCVVLAELARSKRSRTVARRAWGDRDAHVANARKIWHSAFASNGAFEALAAYAGYGGRS